MAEEYSVEQLNHGRRVFDFMRFGKLGLVIAILLVIASFVIMGIRGFNWGLDFTGGTVMELQFSQSIDLNDVRQRLSKSGFQDAIVQNFGSSRDVMIRMAPSDIKSDDLSNQIIAALKQGSDQDVNLIRIEFVGPSVGADLAQSGLMAIIVCLLSILVYIGFRFEWRLALGTVLGLAHDVIITLGIISFIQREVDLTMIAAMLSIIGYSLNDSIVVFDRMRENFRKIRRGTPYEIMNISLTQTLSRTLMTSGTTLAVVLCLYFFGGALIHGFAEALSIGIVLGTLSSIWVSAYIALLLGVKREHLLVQKVEKEGEDQPSLLS